ncbi:MAG: 16S rRNA (cytidine(1402)-2'-O)-methyltransferase [Verrucomicrobiales bacterium]|nr:16S rRNA (cytidine(1402)-2'-O)-methyltransferase [Verrucomicrobiales bacterium]
MLCLIATPIGNLADISSRALESLRSADIVACEDTRHTQRLLSHYDLHPERISLNEHNEARRIPELVARIQAGGRIALVSDAGTPTLADPGQRLVQAVLAAGLPLTVIPGPCAVPTALAGSGLPVVPFYFGGFLSHKKGQREKELQAALQRECTSSYFESPHRLVSTLEMLARLQPDRRVVVARELTKRFEEFQRGTAQNVLNHFLHHPPRGEITLILSPATVPKWVLW